MRPHCMYTAACGFICLTAIKSAYTGRDAGVFFFFAMLVLCSAVICVLVMATCLICRYSYVVRWPSLDEDDSCCCLFSSSLYGVNLVTGECTTSKDTTICILTTALICSTFLCLVASLAVQERIERRTPPHPQQPPVSVRQRHKAIYYASSCAVVCCVHVQAEHARTEYMVVALAALPNRRICLPTTGTDMTDGEGLAFSNSNRPGPWPCNA